MKLENVQLYVATPDEDEHYKFMGNLSSIQNISLEVDDEPTDETLCKIDFNKEYSGTIEMSSDCAPQLLALTYDILVASSNTIDKLLDMVINSDLYLYCKSFAVFYGPVEEDKSYIIDDFETKVEIFKTNRDFVTLAELVGKEYDKNRGMHYE